MEYNKIVIMRDGNTVTAKGYYSTKLEKSAQAVCSPSDTFDFNTGAKLAFERLMKPDKPVQDKPVYKVGDKVKLASKRPCFWNMNGLMDKYLGMVITITRINGKRIHFEGDEGWYFSVADIEPYTEPAKPDKAEKVMLYCVKSYGTEMTKGSIYVLNTPGKIKWNCIESSCTYSSLKDFYDTHPQLKECLIPLVKRPAKVGEWVYVVNAHMPMGAYKNGDVLKVSARNSSGIFIDNPSTALYDTEYLVLSGYQPEPEPEYEWVDGYKGFESDLTCRGYRYKIGRIESLPYVKNGYNYADKYCARKLEVVEEVNKPKWWSGKVVCTKSGPCHTACKAYVVQGGKLETDFVQPADCEYHSVEEINSNYIAQFAELKD